MNPKSNSWLRRFHCHSNPLVRLICCPPAGSSASFYRKLSALSPAWLDVVAVQYPGREDRIADKGFSRLEDLAAALAVVCAQQMDRPIALFGHSMGAAVAFEVARELHKMERAVAHLMVSGRTPPHRSRDRDIHRRDDAAIWDEIARLGATDPSVLENAEIKAVALPYIRADFGLIECYRSDPTPQLNVPISAFLGSEDTEVSQDEMRAWGDVSTGRFLFREYPGGHFYLQQDPARLMSEIVAILSPLTWADTP